MDTQPTCAPGELPTDREPGQCPTQPHHGRRDSRHTRRGLQYRSDSVLPKEHRQSNGLSRDPQVALAQRGMNRRAALLLSVYLGAWPCLRGIASADVEPFGESQVFHLDTATPRVDTDGDGMPD